MSAPAGSAPLVSIGIPLYRARPFVDRIVRNIESIDYPNLEFVIADQHGVDDAVSELRRRVGEDPRVRLFESTDELDWIDNYNFVLLHARGKYFRLLAQDDIVPEKSISVAVACLEADTDVVMACGPEDIIDLHGNLIQRGPDVRPALRSRRFDALALLAGWRHEAANLALVRRAVAADNDLTLPRTTGETGLSMRAWLFGLALRGRVCSLPEYRNQRCVHADSYTTTRWGRSVGEEIARLASYVSVASKLWREAEVDAPARLWGPIAIMIAGGLMLPARRALQRTRRRNSPPRRGSRPSRRS